MLKGIHMTLLVGPVVVFPVPKVVMDALQSVRVTASAGNESASGFELKFTFSPKSPLNTIFLIAGAQSPLLRVIIVVTINSVPTVIMDGVMTNHSIVPGQGGAQSTLSIMGKDLTEIMGRQDFGGLVYPAMPIEARVALILAKYAPFGVIPMIIPTLFPDPPLPTERMPTQEGTDLQYIESLARDVGYVFYVEPGPVPGTNTAYFGPPIKIGVPQPALNVDMDAYTNVEQLTFKFDASKGVLPIVLIQNPLTRIPIALPIPAANPLQPPLGAIPASINNITVLRDTAKLSPMAALSKGVAEAGRSQDAVSGLGSLNVIRYGRLLKARRLVGVRGAGIAFDGLYFVEEVTTDLMAGELKQSFTLSRNGLVSITPRVPP